MTTKRGSMWEFLRLFEPQEWPWCDYTWQGKAIGTFLNFVSIGICMVPVVVFSEAFIRQAVGGTKAPTAAPQARRAQEVTSCVQ